MAVVSDRRKLIELSTALPEDKRAAVDVAALVVLADEACSRREWKHAANILQGALIVDPDHAPAWSLLGRVAQALGDEEPAVEAFATAVMLDDSDLEAAMTLAEIELQTGHHDEARALADWLLLGEATPPELLVRADAVARKLEEVAS